ncbi:hypothetical protein BRADI_2g23745v3 [Brachypodium distachyon]|uniref:Uncharacterized protein n=1 Tax=Brachypodium distachyon TaxID=15368 RepID=A0A2K2DA32_BRADI|nr:hypothetical protein BRADI_2g23745v3 [Brachypodium distachyon]
MIGRRITIAVTSRCYPFRVSSCCLLQSHHASPWSQEDHLAGRRAAVLPLSAKRLLGFEHQTT